MWVFLTIVCAGLGFILCVLVQFFREGKRMTSNREHSSNSNTREPQTGRVVMIDSMQSAQKHSSSKRYNAEWSHYHREIQIRITCTGGCVVVRRIRASTRRTSCISGRHERV